ncbi:MAG TPA: hypothetical protein VJT50_07035 [Pyrinomonadaceae bacterium]|nr:hypothetical protein [Pyrinomonadaceae bacterium]
MPKLKKKKGATKAGAAKPVVLAIDANFDPVTRAPFQHREANVYPQIAAKGFAIVRRQGMQARRVDVAPQARKDNVVYITGVGHGFTNSYTGDNLDPIFVKSQLSEKECAGRIVHFLSCETAAGLGPAFVAKGCRAYFGYSDNFTYPPVLEQIFFECDSEIDRGFAEGLTADEVYKRVVALFQQHIDELKSTGDSGDLHNASILEVDLRLLRAPSVSPEFGDKNARLKLP